MPEQPEVAALAERLGGFLVDSRLTLARPLSFSGLKTVIPSPSDLIGRRVTSTGQRGKYLIIEFGDDGRILLHLGQAGRLDVEHPVKSTKPRGSVVRLEFDNDTSLLLREYGTERKAGWWILGDGDLGPMATLGPEAGSSEFAELIAGTDSTHRLHTWLRDQHVIAGLGRGHTDDVCNRAKLSPFAAPGGLDQDERSRLVASVRDVLAAALERKRQRTGGLSEARLGERFLVHGRKGQPCPNCATSLSAVSFATYEIVYCATCQTRGRQLADRRMSRLLK